MKFLMRSGGGLNQRLGGCPRGAGEAWDQAGTGGWKSMADPL